MKSNRAGLAITLRPTIWLATIPLLVLAAVFYYHAPWAQLSVGLAVLSVGAVVVARGRELFDRRWQTIKRFIIAILVATIVHAVACIIKRPLEFGDGSRLDTFVFAFVSGLVAFPVTLPLVLLPLAAGLRRFMPQGGGRTHAFVAAGVLFGLVEALHLVLLFTHWEPPPHCHGLLSHWAFWSIFAVSVALSFFWPMAGPGDSAQDHAS